jgi:Na+/proline symporter
VLLKDIAVVGALGTTAFLFAFLGVWHARRQPPDLEGYVVSRNRFGSWMIFGTVVSSAMGVWILFSPPQVGSEQGIAGVIGYGLGSAAPLALFAVIGPRVRRLMPQGYSLTEFVLYRYGRAMYLATLVIMLFYMATYAVAELTAIAKAIRVLTDIPDLWIPAVIVMGATFLYTAWGGLNATIVMDVLQFWVIVPLLLISGLATLLLLGGWQAALEPVVLQTPQLLNPLSDAGLKMGLTLILAILSAEVFNQVNWQRIFAGRSNAVVRRAYLASALVTVPMIVIAGGLGILAMHFGLQGDVAFFELLKKLSSQAGLLVAVVVLAIALAMSTLSALLNAIASLLMDLRRLRPALTRSQLLRLARGLTVVLAVAMIGIAAQGYDVLYLFLLADLVCAGALVPILYGLYSPYATGLSALLSSALGILVGALFFPKPDFSAWVALPGAGDLLVSFSLAIAVSTAVCLGWGQLFGKLGTGKRFDFQCLIESRKWDGF